MRLYSIRRQAAVTIALLGFGWTVSAGTVSIADPSTTLSFSGDSFSFLGYTGTVDLPLDGPPVTGSIYFFPSASGSTAVDFLLPLTLDSQSLFLPVTYTGVQILANGTLTFAFSGGGNVDVALASAPLGSSSYVTADFRLYTATASTPEPGGPLLVAAGALILFTCRMCCRRRGA